jgi:hypothetical protein
MAGRTAASGVTPVQRLRRRALWRAEAGLPDRAVLVEWFPIAELEHEKEAARRIRGLCHVHLLRLLDFGVADARNAYALSEAPDGVDLFTVLRAAPIELPPFFGVAVAQGVTRALGAIAKVSSHGRRRAGGHGRVNQGTVFVGWDGSVRLLAFAPAGRSGTRHQEDMIAPELRLSERLLTPAADVYAMGALLRGLLPAASLRRPSVDRLLRRCLHVQADQRMSLHSLELALQELLFELQAPMSLGNALGDLLGQCCPRAAPDLLDTDWGENTGDAYLALPPTLVPLSPSTVPLSPMWLRTAAPKRRGALSTGSRIAVTAALGLGALAALMAWTLSHNESTGTPLTSPLPVQQASLAALAPVLENAPPKALPLLHPGSMAMPWQGLRLSIERQHLDSLRLSLLLRLYNPGREAITPDLSALRLFIGDTDAVGLAPLSPPVLTVGGGRRQEVQVFFQVPVLVPSPLSGWLRAAP